jgi:hypothetical protein
MISVEAPCPAVGCAWTTTSSSPRDAENRVADHYQREHVDPLRCPRCSAGLLSDRRAQARGYCDLCAVGDVPTHQLAAAVGRSTAGA